MDFYNPEDIQRFLQMDKDERAEAVQDWLATVAEPWQGDSAEDILARSMIGSMAALLNASDQVDDFSTVNRHIMGLWYNNYLHQARGFQTLAAITNLKKSFEKGNDPDGV